MPRPRLPSPASLLAFTAIVIALGGSAYAAVKITGAQVTDNSLTSADIKNGTLLAKDFKRGQLKAGKTGPQGVPGAAGLQGGKGDKGDQGDAGPLLDTLQPGRSLRGVYDVAGAGGAAGSVFEAATSFPLALATAPTQHVILNGNLPPAECPGSVADPKATPGNLCVYEGPATSNVTSLATGDPTVDFASGAAKSSRFGFTVRLTAAAASPRSTGTWAVTAP
jgi:hypothetical protein